MKKSGKFSGVGKVQRLSWRRQQRPPESPRVDAECPSQGTRRQVHFQHRRLPWKHPQIGTAFGPRLVLSQLWGRLQRTLPFSLQG